ncbi:MULTISPECIES: hypothetical protein [Parapedobacter]|uniref:hypothetical protein n=1 Tax=Parapedobacter TaxID=416949 RepID=UPI003342908B
MSSSHVKKAIVRFFNAYGLKEYYMVLKHYRFSAKLVGKPMLVSVVDSRRKTKGLTDRFKGIVSVYALAKVHDVPFRCIFNHPMELTDFLVPDTYCWVPTPGELSESVWEVQFRIMSKQPPLRRLTSLFPLRKQVLIYAKVDYLELINRRYKRHYQWGQLFNELFKPTPLLEDRLQAHLRKIGNVFYIACVFRFQALLGDFKEYHFKPLPEADREELIAKNINALRQLADQTDMPVLVTSDSSSFIEAVKGLKNIYTIPGKVVHIDNVADAESEVYLKSFVDFFMLSRARKIYSLGTDIMYKTDFPKYAAKVNNIPFERILIE